MLSKCAVTECVFFICAAGDSNEHSDLDFLFLAEPRMFKPLSHKSTQSHTLQCIAASTRVRVQQAKVTKMREHVVVIRQKLNGCLLYLAKNPETGEDAD